MKINVPIDLEVAEGDPALKLNFAINTETLKESIPVEVLQQAEKNVEKKLGWGTIPTAKLLDALRFVGIKIDP